MELVKDSYTTITEYGKLLKYLKNYLESALEYQKRREYDFIYET